MAEKELTVFVRLPDGAEISPRGIIQDVARTITAQFVASGMSSEVVEDPSELVKLGVVELFVNKKK